MLCNKEKMTGKTAIGTIAILVAESQFSTPGPRSIASLTRHLPTEYGSVNWAG